jgi:hypothetical protein
MFSCKLKTLLILTSVVFLAVFSLESKANERLVAILKDPEVQNKFFVLEEEAKKAHLYQKDNQAYFNAADLRKIDSLSNHLINFINHKYNLDSKKYELHTYIGKYQANSCYQYYNSYQEDSNKDCKHYLVGLSSCRLCNEYINALNKRGDDHILKAHWKNEDILALVDTFKLSNNDDAYIGLELSPRL